MKPTIDEIKASREALQKFQSLETETLVSVKIDGNAEEFQVPKRIFLLLLEILKNTAEGKSTLLLSSETEFTTEQVAKILNVSRPHVVKLLEKGEIPYKKIGSHRRVLMEDLVAYTSKKDRDRAEQLEFLIKQAQDLNLGYE